MINLKFFLLKFVSSISYGMFLLQFLQRFTPGSGRWRWQPVMIWASYVRPLGTQCQGLVGGNTRQARDYIHTFMFGTSAWQLAICFTVDCHWLFIVSLSTMTQCAKYFIGQMNQKPIYLHKLNVQQNIYCNIKRRVRQVKKFKKYFGDCRCIFRRMEILF